MAWIESHQELATHPKTKRFARQLGVSIPAAIGHLHCLWWWALDYADDGNLSAYDPSDLADAMMWDGDPEALVTAMLTCGVGADGKGFLERDRWNRLVIHDWSDYLGRLIEKREAAKARTKRWRQEQLPTEPLFVVPDDPGEPAETAPQPSVVTHNVSVAYGPTVPNPTVPNRTEPNMTSKSAADLGALEGENPRPLREDRALFGEIVRAMKIPPGTRFSRQHHTAYSAAVKDFRDLGVKPGTGQIADLWFNYEVRFGKPPPTPHAVVSHFPECAGPRITPRLNGNGRAPYPTQGGMNGTAANYRPNGRKTESLYFRVDNPPGMSGGSAVPSPAGQGGAASGGVPRLEDLDGLPRSG